MRVTIPWPTRDLSPNGRVHYMVKHRATKRYRRTCLILTMQAGGKIAHGGPIRIKITASPPSACRVRPDEDNLIASLKAAFDGVAEALGVDDSRFRLQSPVIGDPVNGGSITLDISEEP